MKARRVLSPLPGHRSTSHAVLCSWAWDSFLEPGFVPCPALSQADLFLSTAGKGPPESLPRQLLHGLPRGLLPPLLAFVLVDTPQFAWELMFDRMLISLEKACHQEMTPDLSTVSPQSPVGRPLPLSSSVIFTTQVTSLSNPCGIVPSLPLSPARLVHVS